MKENILSTFDLVKDHYNSMINSILQVSDSTDIASYLHDFKEKLESLGDEFKEFENKYIQKEKLLEEIKDITQLGTWEHNFISDEFTWSEEVSKIFGVEKLELTNSRDFFFKLVHPEDRSLVKEAIEQSIINRVQNHFNHRIIRPTGEIRFVSENLKAYYDAKGKPLKLIATVTDITEHKQKEEEIKLLLSQSQRDNKELQANEYELRQTLIQTQSVNSELKSSELRTREHLQQTIELNKKLTESRKLLNEAQEIARLGRWEYDVNTTESLWSEELYKIFRLTDFNQPVSRENYENLFEAQHLKRLEEAIDHSVLNNVPFKLEAQITTQNGVKWIYLIGKPVTDETGSVFKIIIAVLDISERKQAEIALEKNEKLFRQLFENSHDGIFLIDQTSKIIYASPSSSRILGYSLHEILENPDGLSFVHSDYQDYVHQQFLKVLEAPNNVVKMIYRARHKNGGWKWIENIAKNLIHDPDIKSVVFNTRDITEAVESQKALEEREKIFRKLIENSNEAIILCNAEGKVIYASENLEQVLGYQSHEIVQLQKEIIHEDDLAFLKEELRELFSNPNSIKTLVFRVKHKSGEWRWIENIFKNLLNEPVIGGIINNLRDITERKSAEEALKESESRYRILMEEASDGILVYDSEGKFISVNNKMLQMLGYTPQEMTTLDLYSITSKEDRVKKPLRFNKLEKGESVLIERVLKRKDGSTFPAEVSSKKISENTYQSFIRDITERKKAEEIIQKSEAELNALFHALPDLIMVFDREGRILKVSSNIPDLNSLTEIELVGKNIFDIFPHPEASFIFDNIQKVIQPGQAIIQTEQSIEDNDRKFWFNITISPMSDNKVVLVARDISIRKRAEEELLHSKNYLDKIINTIPEPVFVKDSEHRWILLNDALCEYLGLPREFLVGKTDIDFFPEEKARLFLEKDKRVLETGIDDILEEELADSRGFIHTIIMKKSLYHDPHRGKLLVGIINDITARKKIEQKLQNQNEELIKINAELDKFVYRASHDLRAPLVSILGLINIAKMENNLEKNVEYFALMEKSINKLDNFIQSIIHYSRNARLELQVEKIDFNQLINETFDDLKYIESSKKIEIKVEINEQNEFYSDIFRLKIIFNNIISNAIRYYNPRRETPYLLIRIDIDSQHAVIQFEDNGIGISTESVGRIFEMFYRASDSNVGSGLGLYIVKDVVETMKGKIEVKSTLGVGTTFIFDIPNNIKH